MPTYPDAPTDWQLVTTLPPLPPGELQLWRIDLSAAPTPCEHLLPPEELTRAERLRIPHVRQQFTVARAALRTLLGHNLELPPREVPLALSPYGKPEIPGTPLHFNLAHSRSTILIALCRDSPVGVDLEFLDRATNHLEVARTSFTPSEFRQIAQLPTLDAQRRAFFDCWTRKEAIVKADGRGLSLPLTAFEVPVLAPADRTPVVLAETSRLPGAPSTWFITGFALAGADGEEIAAAVAAANPDLRVATARLSAQTLDTGLAG
jgi:4'-phosphopantetheinyl transferase